MPKVLDRIADAIRQRTMNALELAEAQVCRDIDESLVPLAREMRPYIELADLDWPARARRVSAASLVARFKHLAAPADDLVKLDAATKSQPQHFPWSRRGLDKLVDRILDPQRLGLRLSPWQKHEEILRDATDGLVLGDGGSAEVRAEVRAELNNLHHNERGFTAFALAALAFQLAAAKDPKGFGTVAIDQESAQIDEAHQLVKQAENVFASLPEACGRLANRHHIEGNN